MRTLIFIPLMLFLTGCMAMPFPKDMFTSDEDLARQQQQKVEIFQDLLNQGWEIEVYRGKAVLVKHTETGNLVNDVFGVLGE
jgi:hypothetical protein